MRISNKQGEAFILDWTWLLLILWVVPSVAGLDLGAMVLVSSRVSTFQEAYQLGGIVYFSPLVVFIIGLIVWLPTVGLIWYGAQTFKRGELIARL